MKQILHYALLLRPKSTTLLQYTTKIFYTARFIVEVRYNATGRCHW